MPRSVFLGAGCALRKRKLELGRGVQRGLMARGSPAEVLLRSLGSFSRSPPEPKSCSPGTRDGPDGQEVSEGQRTRTHNRGSPVLSLNGYYSRLNRD